MLPKPLFIGRVLRVLSGLVCFYLAFGVVDLPITLWESLGALALGLLGLSFVVGGLLANPGCEVTALPNLVLKRKRHCLAGLFPLG